MWVTPFLLCGEVCDVSLGLRRICVFSYLRDAYGLASGEIDIVARSCEEGDRRRVMMSQDPPYKI